MTPSDTLTPQNADGIVGALAGNGTLCTTLGPTGYHCLPEECGEIAAATQRFAMAGRRRPGPQWPLVDFGTLRRSLSVDGSVVQVEGYSQRLDLPKGRVVSSLEHTLVREETLSCVLLSHNLFVVETTITNISELPVSCVLVASWSFGESDAVLEVTQDAPACKIGWQLDNEMGEVRFGATSLHGALRPALRADARGAAASITGSIEPGESSTVRVWVHFSDRSEYQFPITPRELETLLFEHETAWGEFWAKSDVVTGDPLVDDFRRSALYTLRCQATPWSIPPTVTEKYWGGGAFHDEMYPFFGLISAGHGELARRIPHFRLATLQRALERGKGMGALYPWSSTERGEERDPHGLWLTERFHLAQISLTVWSLYLYERDRIVLDDLYPVLREIARYFENEVIVRGRDGGVKLRPCVDFDESVGCVEHGPFTVTGTVSALRCAANAAGALGRDGLRAKRWLELADEVAALLVVTDGRYAIPGGKYPHSSVLGPVWPFRVDLKSHIAQSTAAWIHATCKSSMGWRPGHSPTFDGHTWMWAAGHLATAHAWLGNGNAAWEAIQAGPLSAGPLLSPNEHRDANGTVQVPWFTTGCGAWLAALHSLFVQVDEIGAKILPALPLNLPSVKFSGIAATHGVQVSGTVEDGMVTALSAISPIQQTWKCRISAWWLSEEQLRAPVSVDGEWYAMELALKPGEETSLLKSNDSPYREFLNA